MPTKFHLVKAMVFPVVMYGCESWTIKKAEHQRIDAFELWCWRRLLGVPWTARRSNQSILKEIIGRTDTEAKTPIVWPSDVKNWLLGKDTDAGKDWRPEKRMCVKNKMYQRQGISLLWKIGYAVCHQKVADCLSKWTNWLHLDQSKYINYPFPERLCYKPTLGRQFFLSFLPLLIMSLTKCK